MNGIAILGKATKVGCVARVVAVWIIAGIMAGPAVAGDIEDGVAAYERGDYQAAIELWMPLADANDVNALFNMGQLYRMGKGVSKDPVMAEYFYRRAAERGHVAAQGNLGTLYYFGFDDSPRVGPALEWWQKAARGGDPRSQYMLGILYYNGTHMARDPVRAYAWIRKAAVAGLPEAIDAEKTLIRDLSVKELAAGNNLAPRVQELPIETGFTGTAPAATETADASAALPLAEESADSALAAVPVSEPSQETPAEETPDVIPDITPDETGAVAAIAPGYYVQLVASGSAARAETARDSLQKAHDALTYDQSIRIEEAALDDGRTIYRLLLGAFATKEAASGRCADFKGRGQDCFVVKR